MSRYDGRLLVLATTFAGRAEAERAAAVLVGEGLAACGQVGADLVSCYRWQGEVATEREVRLLLKVREDRYAACATRLKELHPYDVPQITAWRADRVDEDYGRWAWQEEA